jgi:osmotically-inducible protein OsmY
MPRPPAVSLMTRVQERLRMDRRLGRVKAYSAGGVVTLYGKVFDDKSRRLAVATAKSVDGVTDVIDNLQTDTASWAQNQSQINAQLQAAGLSQVTVKVIGHDAYLDGQVSTQAEKEHAVTVAEGAAPVRVRTNLIRVVPKGLFSF